MLTYDSIALLVHDIATGRPLADYDFIYMKANEWSENPANAKLYLPTFEEEEEDPTGDGPPPVVGGLGLKSLLSVRDLEGVVTNFRRARPDGSVEDLIKAINHYREYDAYKYL